MNKLHSRRRFIGTSILAGIGMTITDPVAARVFKMKSKMRLGLVTYLWGKDWDLPTLIANCEEAGIGGVELRTEHAHGVEINLSASERADVKKRFDQSPVTCAGYGSNYAYHFTDKTELRKNIEDTKAYIQLCSDIGASGIKVKPNALPKEVSREHTIAQIADSLNDVGAFAKNLGQEVRVEVHGKQTQELPNMKAIFEQVTEDNVKICWNCNDTDLLPPGLEENFKSVQKWFGQTVHIRELNVGDYPYQDLMSLFKDINYDGWILLEARTDPGDKVEALKKQKKIFEQMIS